MAIRRPSPVDRPNRTSQQRETGLVAETSQPEGIEALATVRALFGDSPPPAPPILTAGAWPFGSRSCPLEAFDRSPPCVMLSWWSSNRSG